VSVPNLTSAVSLNHPPAWRRIVKEAVASCRAGSTSISISATAGSGRSLILDEIQKRLTDDYEHVLRVDGRVFAVAEREIRRWLTDIDADQAPSAFNTLQELLIKSHHVAILIDRADPNLLARVDSPELGGAIVASISPGDRQLSTHYDLPPYPVTRGWHEVKRRRNGGIVVAGKTLGPAVSAIEALAQLHETTLRDLIEACEPGTATNSVEIHLRQALVYVLPLMSGAERDVLRTLTLLGAGATRISSLDTVSSGRLSVISAAEVPGIIDQIAARGLLVVSDGFVYLDAGLIEAVQEPRSLTAAQRRSAVYLISRLDTVSTSPEPGQMNVALRLLSWCRDVGFDDKSVSELRETVIEYLVAEELLESAHHELQVAIDVDQRRGDAKARAHHQVDAGLVTARLGMLTDALRLFEGALADFGTTSKSQRNEAVTLSNIAMIQQQRGKHREAVQTLDQARSLLFRAKGDTSLEDINLSITLTVSLLRLGETSRAEAEIDSITSRIDQCSADVSMRTILQADLRRLQHWAADQQTML